MSDDPNSVVAPRSKDSFQKHGNTQRITCLLCRVLWPRSVQHRHVFFIASEANDDNSRNSREIALFGAIPIF